MSAEPSATEIGQGAADFERRFGGLRRLYGPGGAQRIFDADLAYPVILNAEGQLMDGAHRLAKAWMEGRTHIAAVRFPVTPDPDWMMPAVGPPQA